MGSLNDSRVTEIAAALKLARAEVARLKEEYDLAVTKARVRFTFYREDRSHNDECIPVLLLDPEEEETRQIEEGGLMGDGRDIGFCWENDHVKLWNRTFEETGEMMTYRGLRVADQMPREVRLQIGETYEGAVWTKGRFKIEVLPATDN